MPGKGRSFGIVCKVNNILDDRTSYSKNQNIFYKKRTSMIGSTVRIT